MTEPDITSSREDPTRLAHAMACRELSDRARMAADITADHAAGHGHLVEEAVSLLRSAERIAQLAAATEAAALAGHPHPTVVTPRAGRNAT